MRVWRSAIVLAATVVVTHPAPAEMSVSTEANVAVEYNDNIRLAPQAGQDAVGRYAVAGASLFLSGPAQQIRIAPSLRAQRYSGAQELDNEDYFLDLSADRSLEYSTLSLQGNYYRDTALANDIDTSGLVEIGVRRERSGIRPAWTLELSPRSRLRLGLNYDRVVYGETTAFGTTVDYGYTATSAVYSRELVRGDELSATLSASRLDAPDISNQADHQGVQIDYALAVTERLRASASAGFQRSRFAQRAAPVKEDAGALIGFRLTAEGEYRTADLSLARTVEPSGTGTLMQNDNLTLALAAEMTPDLRSTLSLLLSDRSDLQGVDPGADRRLAQAQLGLGWTVSGNWLLSAVYRYTRQHYERSGLEAGSNAVMFALGYAGEQSELMH